MQITPLIKEQLPFEPTPQQEECIIKLDNFLLDPDPFKVFLLHGYAGTGKTSLVSALVEALKIVQYNTILLAPTGRAAKVLANYSNHSAWSIHKEIYRQKSITQYQFSVGFNKHKNTLFIVDEASMIGNSSSDKTTFGSGRLLDDLIEYIYGADNCAMILIGDTAQLLPVMQNDSPAMNPGFLRGYGLNPCLVNLTDVVRQKQGSGILFNATHLRQIIKKEIEGPPQFQLNFPDIVALDSQELIDEINSSYGKEGIENTIILTYSNKRATLYNRGIRNQVLMSEDEISTGDYLLITKNNYFWSKPYDNLDFLANGDIAEITHMGKTHHLYDMRFVDLTVRLLDYDMEVDVRIILDMLYAETPKEASDLYHKLFYAVEEDYMDVSSLKERYKQMRENEYLNALHTKFAYAITTHKAQGGQWQHVYVDQGYINPEAINQNYYQWLYTAFTRAQKKLYLINFNQFFLANKTNN